VDGEQKLDQMYDMVVELIRSNGEFRSLMLSQFETFKKEIHKELKAEIQTLRKEIDATNTAIKLLREDSNEIKAELVIIRNEFGEFKDEMKLMLERWIRTFRLGNWSKSDAILPA